MYQLLLSDEFLNVVVWGNSVNRYILAVLAFLVLAAMFKIVQWVTLRSVVNITKRTKTKLDDALVRVVKTIRPPFYIFLSFYLALQYLNVVGIGKTIADAVLLVWVVYQVIIGLRIIIDVYVEHRIAMTDDRMTESVAHVIHSLANIVLWALGGLFVLQNLGVNVTSLIAGLGIGGIAVALAAQNVLGDLFNSLAIYFDKPFVPGDFITFGDSSGTVQKVGIKTTRIKALSGEEIVVPNTKLTSAQVHNFGRLTERRIVFEFGVVYETVNEKMRDIPGLVEEIIQKQTDARFDRCHFKKFADSSLVFEVVYHAETNEYKAYMTMNESILLGIKQVFEERGIQMAYPTQTVYMKRT